MIDLLIVFIVWIQGNMPITLTEYIEWINHTQQGIKQKISHQNGACSKKNGL
jgi:hypothetical protein